MKNEIAFSLIPFNPKMGCLPLTIQIAEVSPEVGNLRWVSQPRKLYEETLLDLTRGKDREYSAVKTLIEEKKRSLLKQGLRQSSAGVDYSEIVIEPKRSIPILKELAATGKLYFKQKELIAHFFSGHELFYRIESREKGSYLIEGIIRGSEEYSLSSCELIGQGDPFWVIYRQSLYLIKGDVSWKWMRRAFEERPFCLSQKEADRFFEEVEPASILGQKVQSLPDPFPVLLLTDPRGVFANLFMDYGSGLLVSFEDSSKKERNLEAEAGWKKDLLEAGYQEKKVGSSSFYCPVDKIATTLLFLLELGWTVRDRFNNQVLPQSAIEFQLNAQDVHVTVQGTVKFGEQEASLASVVQAAKRGEPLFMLPSGVTGLISKDALEVHSSALFQGEILGDKIRIPKHDFATLEELFEQVPSSIDFSLEPLKEALKNRKDCLKEDPSAAFKGTLREYQKEGVGWLFFLYRHQLHGILADDMGLGKTVQVLAFLSKLNLKHPVLIVMPRSLLFHWKSEIGRFLPSLSVKVYHGIEKENGIEGAQVILTSYGTLRQDLAFFEKISLSCLILDEAQAIKNSSTQTAQVLRKLKAEFRLSITGTPIENHIGELIAQFDFLFPGFFDKEAVLNPLYVKKKARPFILRRRKEEVDEELPEKIEQNVLLEMDLPQRTFYDGFVNGLKQGLLKKISLDGMSSHRMEIFEAILRLRQICCHPLLLDGESEAASIKMEALFLDLETVREEGKKALVYSQFTSVLQLIAKRCQDNGWSFAYLDGSTKNREEAVKQFQEDAEIPFFLISLKAGGVGLNLTAADYVFLFDPWWNEAVERQAIDRAHRIGRHDTVIAKRYVVKDTIEERMMLLKQSKKNFAEDLFDESTCVAGDEKSLAWEDLEYLLI